jgi:7-keto-8-aminopelargonate synthetase-like enzyme
MDFRGDDGITRRMAVLEQRVQAMRDLDCYFYNQPVEEVLGGSKVIVNGREMGMYASYSYLGLIGHPRINAAAKAAVDRFGTGTHGVRTLAGTCLFTANWRRQ